MPDKKLSPEEFYRKYYPIVAKRVKGTSVHPETVMAQMAIETDYGNKVEGNNFFGNKGSGQLLNTTEEINGVKKNVKRNFSKYNSFEESLDDYINNITTNPRYKDSLAAKTPEEQIELIAKGGYASGSGYAKLGKDVIRDNKSQIKKIMGKNNAEILSENKSDNGSVTKIKLSDGSVIDVPMNKGDAFVQLGSNTYLYSADKNKMAKVPTSSKGINSRFYSMESNFHDNKTIYANAGSELLDDVMKNGLDESNLDSLHTLMNMDMLSDSEKEKLLPEFSKKVFDPIKSKLENEQKSVYENDIRDLKIQKANLGPTDPKRNDIDAQIAERQSFIDKQYSNNTWKNYNQATMSYGDFKKEFENWSGQVRMENYGSGSANPNYNQNNTQVPSDGGAGGYGSFRYSKTTRGNGYPNTSIDASKYANYPEVGNEKSVALDVNMEDLDKGVITKNNPLDREGLLKSIDEDKNLIESIKNKQSTPFVYGPDSQPKHDIAGYIADIGRVAIGMKGANEKLPEYNTSEYFNKYTNDAINRKDMGLLPQEKDYMNMNAEKAYAYDVKNINKMSGGSAGVALANLGRAGNSLSENYMKIAATDAAQRDQNWNNFANAASQVENVNQYKFGLKYDQAMNNKMAGSKLASDAITNILDRNQYEKAYGKDSPYYNYQKYLSENIHADTEMLKASKESMMNQSISDLEESIRKKQEQLDLDQSANTLSATGDNYNPIDKKNYAQGLINSITSNDGASTMTAAPKGAFDKGLSVDQIKVMEANGDKVYSSVYNTSNYKQSEKKISDNFDNHIANLKQQINTGQLDSETGKAKLQELQNAKKEIMSKLEKEQELWADQQFDNNDKFIGSGDGMPTFDWLDEEINKYLK